MKDNYVQTSTNLIYEKLGDKFYSIKSECACFSHDLEVHLETLGHDEEKIIEMTIYDDVYIGEDFEFENWLDKLLFRIKCSFKCLFGDGFKVTHGFVFKGEEHLKQFQIYFNDRCNDILNVKKSTTNKHPKRHYNKNLKQKTNKEETNK